MLVILVSFGRLGPLTLATALALRGPPRRFEYPRKGRSLADTLSPIAVIDLGRFGGSVAHGLTTRGGSLLAIDADMAVVRHHSETLRDVVCADFTDELSLRQLGLDAGWRAVVSIGRAR